MRSRSDFWKSITQDGNFHIETKARIGDSEYVDYTEITAPQINNSLAGDFMSIGNCTVSTLALSIVTNDTIQPGSKVVVMGRVTDSAVAFSETQEEDFSEWKDFGTFFINKRDTSYDGIVTIECFDSMMLTNQDFETADNSELVYPRAMSDVVLEIATRIGVELDSRTVINTGSDYVVDSVVGMTMMQVLGYIGACHGGNWIITPDNKLRLVQYESLPDVSTLDSTSTETFRDDAMALDSTDTGFVPFVLGNLSNGRILEVTGLYATNLAGDSFSYGNKNGAVIEILDNPYVNQTIASNVYNAYVGRRYMPFDATTSVFDPCLELGDRVIISPTIYGIVCSMICNMDIGFRADVSAPNSEELSSEFPYLSQTKAAIKKIESDIEGIAEDVENVSTGLDELEAEAITADDVTFTVTPVVVDGQTTKVSRLDASVGSKVFTTYTSSQGDYVLTNLGVGTSTADPSDPTEHYVKIDTDGLLTAKNALIYGTIYANNGSFSGSITSTNGTIGGWTIDGNVLQSKRYDSETQTWNRTGMVGMNQSSTLGGAAFYAGCPNESGAVVGNAAFYVTHGGKIYAESGVIGGWSLTSSALYRGNSSFGNANGMYLGANGFSVMDRFKVDKNGFVTIYNPGVLDDGSSVPYTFKFNHDSGFVIECKSGGVNRNMFGIYAGENNKTPTITSSQGFINIRPDIETNGHITIQNSTAAFRAYDSNGTARNLMYITSGDNVSINGGGVGNTVVGSPLIATGTITGNSHIYWGGASGWNGGVSGGFADSTGQVCIIGSDSSHLPRINFVTNKKTTSAGYTQLRVNNTSGTNYVLTLPNSTGTIAVSSSDARLKEQIQDSKVSAIDVINKIRLREFDWLEDGKEGSPHWPIGMIADELEEIDSNLAFGGGTNPDGTMNVKGIDMLYLLGYTVKAIQELSLEIKRAKQIV